MKKILALLGLVLLPAFVFAATEVEYDCEAEKEAFAEYVSGQNNDYFISQHVLVNLADPMREMSDWDATPHAVCYVQYVAHGKRLPDFVRLNAGKFQPKEKAQLLEFAGRSEALVERQRLEKMVAKGNTSHIMEFVLINLADSMRKLSDEEAVTKARVYADIRVNGVDLVQFVKDHAVEYPGDTQTEFDAFAQRVEQLAK